MTPPGTLRLSLPFCGLPCPPALLTFEGDRIASAAGACGLCLEEVQAARANQPRVAGRDAGLEAALDRAAGLLKQSRRPFVHGLAASPVGTARLAAKLAARIDAALDIEGAGPLEAEITAVAATGQVTATFGEMRAAADLVVLWRVDPRSSHPHLFPDEVDGGARRFVAVPPSTGDPVERPRPGDLVVPVPRGRDLEALQHLRGLLRRAGAPNTPAGRPSAEADAGLPVAGLREAAAAIASARRVAILWDAGISVAAPAGPAIAAGFALLTLDARGAPRIAAKALGPGGNVAGAMAGLLSATGFPRAIGFSSGRPRRDPDRFGAARMIEGDGADLVIAIEPRRSGRLSRVPAIVIGSRRSAFEPEVFLPVAPAALRRDGLWLRADGVPLPRRAASREATPLLSEAAILEALLDRLRAAA